MTTVVRWVGVLMAVGFMALSLLINWRYGVRLGRDGIDQWIFSFASLLADVAKSATPFMIVLALARRQWTAGLAGAAFWLICTCYSLLCIAGFMEANHAVAAGGLANQQETEGHLRADLRRKQSEREALGSPGASTVVAAKIVHSQQNRRWTGSGTCTIPRDAADRAFCAGLAALEVERAQARETERLDREAVLLRQQIAALSGTTQLGHGDPRVAFLSRFVTWQKTSIEAFLALLLLALLEIGSGLGLYMAIGHGALRPQAVSTDAARNDTATDDATINDTRSMADVATTPEQPRRVATGRVMPRLDAAHPYDNDQQVGGEGETTSTAIVGDVAKFARTCLQPSPGNAVTMAALYARYSDWCKHGQRGVLEVETFTAAMIALAETVPMKRAHRRDGGVLCDLELATG
jgi:hypothetical protein